MRGRDERGALRDEWQARRRRLVDVRVEQDRVVALALATQELEQPWRVGTLHREPRLLVGSRMPLEQDMPLGILERRTAHTGHRETPNADRTVHRFADREMRRPAPVVERVRRHHLDLVHHRKPVRNYARV